MNAKRIAEALVECGYADDYHNDQLSTTDKMVWDEFLEPFADTLEGHRQLMALYFYTLFPDKQHTITGDGHFDAYEQIKNHVKEYFDV